jgi:hypothetical protein
MTSPTHKSLCLLALLIAAPALAQSLQLTYGAKGVQTLTFSGTRLEDTTANPNDTFHIWHTRLTDLNGNLLNGSQGEYGWGETNLGELWNPATSTETYTFTWGSIATQFAQHGNNLDLIVTETNNPGSGVILDGAEIYPFALHFPQDPSGFSGYTQYAITTLGPGVSVADYGTAQVTSVVPNESTPVYTGWKTAGTNTYTPILTTTAPDGLPAFLPGNNLPLNPGTTLTYIVSLRFTPEGTPASAADAYASFAQTYPSQMTWTDHRAIGTAYLASSPATPPSPAATPPTRAATSTTRQSTSPHPPASPPSRTGSSTRPTATPPTPSCSTPRPSSPGTSKANSTPKAPATSAPPTRSPPLPPRWNRTSSTKAPPSMVKNSTTPTSKS